MFFFVETCYIGRVYVLHRKFGNRWVEYKELIVLTVNISQMKVEHVGVINKMVPSGLMI